VKKTPYKRRYATVPLARKLALKFLAGEFDPESKRVRYLAKLTQAKLFKPSTIKIPAHTWHYD